MRICKVGGALVVVALGAMSVSLVGQQPPVLGYDDTPMQPNGKWHVHDPKRPRPPGEWQTYDIVFTAPRFKSDRTLDKPAIVTVLHNGVVVHNGTAFFGPTQHRKIDPYAPDNAKGPIALQDHGNPVRFRNIWIR